jgi:aminoglycoside phosphotransferase (APT) family kinase protein
MNAALTFIDSNRRRLRLEHLPPSSALSTIVLTPRFRASAHVIVLVFGRGSPEPVLVVKLGRLPGDCSTLDREAFNLRALGANRSFISDGGSPCVPQLLSDEAVAGTRLLLQTAVPGRPLTRRAVRRRPRDFAALMTAWIANLHAADHEPRRALIDPSSSLLEPLRTLRDAHSESVELVDLVTATLHILEALGPFTVPSAFEHGDWAAPNILITASGELGVVDWELADPIGLPAVDLFFGLTYVALSVKRASTPEVSLAGFTSAFVGRSAWAAPYVGKYASRVGLSEEVLPALFLATWTRQFLALLARLPGDDVEKAARLRSDRWLQSNRAFALWKQAVEDFADLGLCTRPLQIGVS